ncbi:MAG: APC family permease [Candidatus Thermoplasmatota archaeon]|jgi:amino acid transporter|nr:APC family permease [Candidatus Thermoplasmatota archaeon]
MTDKTSALDTQPSKFRLRSSQVGVWGAIAEEISAMAPACDTVAFMTSAAAFAFFLTPLAFLIATLTMFLEVNTLYHLSRRHASAGGYYGYIGTAFGPTPAITSGLLYVMYQIASTAAIPVYVGGVVLPGVLELFLGISLPGWIWIPFILVFILAPITLAIFGIRPQMKYIRIAAFFEVIFLAVLSLVIILEAKDNTLAVFNPFTKSQVFNSVGGPLSGLGLGMIFGLTSFIGYGGSAPLGEEAVNSRAITKSLVFGLVIVGIVLTEVAYALTVGWGVSLMSTFATANIPGILVATAYTGAAGGIMLSLVAFNSAFSDSVAMQSNAGRVYFAMGRDGVLPSYFAQLHEKYVTPHKALLFIGTMASLLAIGGTAIVAVLMHESILNLFMLSSSDSTVSTVLGNSFNLLTTLALFGLIITHILLNTSVMTLFYRLKEKHHGIYNFIHVAEHYVLPVVATVIFAWVLYESIYPPVFPITEAVLAAIAYLIFALYYARMIVRKKPEVARRAGKSVNLVEEEKLEQNTN